MSNEINKFYELNDKFISVIAELNNINKYETIKSELSDEQGAAIRGGKIKLQLNKKSSAAKQNKAKLKMRYLPKFTGIWSTKTVSKTDVLHNAQTL